MATTYEISVAEGTASAVGGTLAEAESWSFTTPPVTRLHTWPVDGPHDLEPLFFLSFDQAIDIDAILPFIEVRGGGSTASLRLATEAEIERDEGIRASIEATEEDRWIALALEQPLERDTNYTIRLKKGAPSAEGPNVTAEAQDTHFYTYAPLRVE